MYPSPLLLRLLAVTAALSIAFIASGCANPAQPRPPSLRLPEKARLPTASRVADHVEFTWTTPEKTTDGDLIRGKVTAVLCRETQSVRVPPPCTSVQRVTVIPGPGAATESLPAALVKGPPTLLIYRVELLNAAGRSAGQSAAIYAVGGVAPTPLTSPLAISGRRDGAAITWPPVADTAPVYLTRTLIQPPGPPKPQPAKARGFTSSKTEPAVVRLKPEGESTTDPGGTIDRTVIAGNAYTYIGERVLNVTLAGHALQMHGLPSTPATFTFVDTFPPAAPSGLVSIPGGGFGDALSIDLSWDPNPEPDILGYNIYRSESGFKSTRINAEPIPASAFRDLAVAPGHTYLYTVTAVDQHHNESAASTEIHETLRK